MYSTKEKLSHFRSLLAPDTADADLQLLKEKDPGNSNLVRFSLTPAKNAEDILFALLDVCTHDEIVRNRRDFIKAAAPAQETADAQNHGTVLFPADVQSTSEQSQEPETDSTSEQSQEPETDSTSEQSQEPETDSTSEQSQEPKTDSTSEESSDQKKKNSSQRRRISPN